jgi:hypothetical protein
MMTLGLVVLVLSKIQGHPPPHASPEIDSVSQPEIDSVLESGVIIGLMSEPEVIDLESDVEHPVECDGADFPTLRAGHHDARLQLTSSIPEAYWYWLS